MKKSNGPLTISAIANKIRVALASSSRSDRVPVAKEAVRIAGLKIDLRTIRRAARLVLRKLENKTPVKNADFVTACEDMASPELLAALRLADGLRSFAPFESDRPIIERMIEEAVGSPVVIPWETISPSKAQAPEPEEGLDADAQDQLAAEG